MAALNLWTNPLAALLPGAIPAQVEEKLRHAVREFYLQSRAWRRVLGPFNVTAATSLVTLNPVDATSQVVWIRDAWLQEGALLTHLSPRVNKISQVLTGRPTHFYSETPYTMNLWPTPDATLTNVLYVDAAMTPTDAAATFPDLAATHHFEAIMEGALARLLAMPNKPWSDPLAAAQNARQFRRRCLELRAVSDAGYTRSDPPWRFPSFA